MSGRVSATGTNNGSGRPRPVVLLEGDTLRAKPTFVEHLLVGLSSEGCRPAVVCGGECNLDLVSPGGIEAFRCRTLRPYLLRRRTAGRIVQWLERFKPTVLHALSPYGEPMTRMLADRLGVPFIFDLDCLVRPPGGRRVFSRPCAGVVVSAHTVASYLCDRYPWAAEHIHQINPGAFVEESCACFCRQSEIASIVLADRLDRVERFEPFLAAIKHLVIDGFPLAVVIVGAGRAEARIRRLVGELGLGQVVSIAAPVSPLRAVFAGADIFVRAQPAMCFESCLLEAMSVGTAVAGCRGGVDDLLVEGRTALTFEGADELAIYSCLGQLLTKRDFARRLAVNAQLQVRRDYSPGRMVAAYVELYERAAREHKGTSAEQSPVASKS